MSEQNCVLACGLGQGRLRAAIGRSFTTVRLAVPEISCSLPLRNISTAARFTPCLLPPPAAARRKTPFESPSYQKRKALLRSAHRIGIRSRLRARSGSALTCHRQVIHSRPVRIPPWEKRNRRPVGVCFVWRRGRDSNPCALSRKLISS